MIKESCSIKTWLYQGGNWYAFKSSGAMIASDWLYDQGKWYYLSTSGAMKASAWVYDKGEWYYVSSSGAMLANDWIKDNGKWYYLASSGKMLRNTYTPDGYYVGNSVLGNKNKKSFSFKEGAFYLLFCCFLICPEAFFVLK